MPPFLIAETLDGEGAVTPTTLALTEAGAVLTRGAEELEPLPIRAILLTMRRLGREVEPDFAPDEQSPTLELGAGVTLSQLHFRAIVDAEPKLYLVLKEPGGEPLCALARDVTSALSFLAEKSR